MGGPPFTPPQAPSRAGGEIPVLDVQLPKGAGEIYRSHSIDWDAIASWAENEKPEFNGVERLRAEADSQA